MTKNKKRQTSNGRDGERASELRGALAISQKEGAQLGGVAQLYFNPNTKKLSSVSIRKHMFREDRFVNASNIEGVGENVVFVRSKKAVKTMTGKGSPSGRSLKELQGTWVTTLGGNHLGALVDVEIDPKEWTISDLLLADGKRLSVRAADITIGRDDILVPEDASEKLKDSDKDNQGLLRRFFGEEAMDSLSTSLSRAMKQMKQAVNAKRA